MHPPVVWSEQALGGAAGLTSPSDRRRRDGKAHVDKKNVWTVKTVTLKE